MSKNFSRSFSCSRSHKIYTPSNKIKLGSSYAYHALWPLSYDLDKIQDRRRTGVMGASVSGNGRKCYLIYTFKQTNTQTNKHKLIKFWCLISATMLTQIPYPCTGRSPRSDWIHHRRLFPILHGKVLQDDQRTGLGHPPTSFLQELIGYASNDWTDAYDTN